MFELGRAPVSERGVEPLAVVDFVDEGRQPVVGISDGMWIGLLTALMK